MAQIHCQLMAFYKGQGIKLVNLTSKTHVVLHSLYYARWLHPSLVWCYKGEDQMQRMAKLWKSCLDGSKHWQTAKRAAWKERHLLFLRSKVGWEKKVSPSSIHTSVLLQLPLCSYLCSIPTCAMSLAIAWLHSLHVWSFCTCRSCVLLHMPYMKVLLVIKSRAINSSLGFYLCKLMNYNLTSLTTCVIFLHMSFLCSATYALYESFTCDQTQGQKFKLEILLASQNKLLPKFQKERKH